MKSIGDASYKKQLLLFLGLKFLNFTEEKDINKFLNFVKNDKIIEFLNFTEKEDIIQFMVDNNMCDQIATFILTTCLFIGK